MLRPAVSVTDIQESLASCPSQESNRFYMHDSYDYIVYYDESTQSASHLPATIQSLRSAIAPSGVPCQLLAGGLQGWVARYGLQSLALSPQFHRVSPGGMHAPDTGAGASRAPSNRANSSPLEHIRLRTNRTILTPTQRNAGRKCFATVEIESDVDSPSQILLTCHECDFHTIVGAADVHPANSRSHATTRDNKRIGYSCLVQKFHHSNTTADGRRRAAFKCFLCGDM
ncbi:hypothetical protein B0A48_13469 [Cryoendolithus antarcticus]|uniref:Rhodanese domain-containing protein n=1 Tax=Cryoendolithus antarcticus TaxID=1507870 RepID=A0A1V8SPF5_9PEZI|nr:hypothetical protein B0A48_13469 [Cryoendolithus antarcticus]